MTAHLPRPLTEAPAVSNWVLNPFGRSLRKGIDLNALIASSPDAGAQTLQTLAEETLTELKQSGSPVLYLLFGAAESWCTPMEFGGLYLELEREILSAAIESKEVLLWVAGNENVYLDFVSDLPAAAIGWNQGTTGFGVREMRELRDGTVFGPAADADFQWIPEHGGKVSDAWIEEVLNVAR